MRITMQVIGAILCAPTATLLFTLAHDAQAAPYDEGLKALDRWDTVRATAHFEAAGKQGDGRGPYELALLTADVRRQTQVDLFERAAALGEPRAKHWLASIQIRASDTGRKTDIRFAQGPERIPKLLADACEGRVVAACGDLAALYAADEAAWTVRAGLSADVVQAKRWGDLWRAGRVREAEKGDVRAISDIVVKGGNAWAGMAAADLHFYRTVLDDLDGDGSAAPSADNPATAPADLRRRVDAWEIAQGLRPARLPAVATLAARIAAFEAADELTDAEVIAADGRYLAATTLGAYRYGADERRAWGAALGKATAAGTRLAEAFERRLAADRKRLGLDTQTWLAQRLAVTFTPMQLHAMARIQATTGARKRALAARLVFVAALDGDAIAARLAHDPGMARLGADVPERQRRYAEDRGIDASAVAADPLVAEREQLLAELLSRRRGGNDPFGNRVAVIRLGHAAWTRAAGLLSRRDADEIRDTLRCGPCRGTARLLKELRAEWTRTEPMATAIRALDQQSVEAVERAGIPLQEH